MTHHGQRWSSGPILGCGKSASERRGGIEDWKKVRRNVDSLHLLRHAAAAYIEARPREIVSAHVLERLRVLFPSHELGNGHRRAIAIGEFERQPYQPVGLAVGKRLQQDAIYDGENGSIGPDTESQGGYRHDSEPRALSQPPAGVPYVLQQGFHRRKSPSA